MKKNKEAIEFFKTKTFADLIGEVKRQDGTLETNPLAIQMGILQFRDSGMMDADTADRLIKEGFGYYHYKK